MLRARPLTARDILRPMVVFFAAAALAVSASPVPPASARSGPTNNDAIARLYLGVLGRTPELAGEVYWNHREGSGMSLRDMADFFVSSPEFSTSFGTGPEAVVEALYRNVLGRTPDVVGRQWWLDAIEGGMPIREVVIGFTESPENKAKLAELPTRYNSSSDGCADVFDEYFEGYVNATGMNVTAASRSLSSDCGVSGYLEDQRMPVGSVFKLALLGAALLRSQDMGEPLSPEEVAVFEGMIRYSDDDQVRSQLGSFGGTTALLEAYGPRLGLSNVQDNPRWGCVAWDALSSLGLVEHLTVPGVGELTEANQALARRLMTSVIDSQRWGVGDGTLSVAPLIVAQKNGFANPCPGTGSKVNSVGVVLSSSGEALYSLAVLSEGWSAGAVASRSDDRPIYVVEAHGHINNLAEHVARKHLNL